MAKIHNLGFPRIGEKRELKFLLEKYWQGDINEATLKLEAKQLRRTNIEAQQDLDFTQVGDFSFYDHVLDTSFLFGNVPARATQGNISALDAYFRAARGHASPGNDCCPVHAAEMTKWFDTNYHYIVPEFNSHTTFDLHANDLLGQINEVRAQGGNAKPVILGPLSYLFLGKATDDSDPLLLLDSLLVVYQKLFDQLARAGVEWVQLDEPALVTELPAHWQMAYKYAYQYLAERQIKVLLTTYFGELQDNLELVCQLPIDGVHIDAIRAKSEVALLAHKLKHQQVLSVGIIDGRNVWKTDLNAALDFLQPIAEIRGENLWLAPSCSLLHVPVNLAVETDINSEVKDWLAFAVQKLQELSVLGDALNFGAHKVTTQLTENRNSLNSRKSATIVHDAKVQLAQQTISSTHRVRSSSYDTRREIQGQALNLPLYPTTTIGSFPQTADIRATRQAYRQGKINQHQYKTKIQAEIKTCINHQEEMGLDVLVHGEAERNDMVEYFGEQLNGFVFSRFGWVQSYGSRCVKPPIIFGDVSRPHPMTLHWIEYAQSLTNKPVKGMLTGPVTILNWSFVRDDQSRAQTCEQIALAIRAEVQDLEKSGVRIIQIDEAALREGLPLRKSQWPGYLSWAIDAFKLAANGVSDDTQIHTHMCYSQFNDIIHAIGEMDADVITIETSRSDMRLLGAFDAFAYPNDIGPGVYDIHSPNVPEVDVMVRLIELAGEKIPAQRIWVNPDCGLKTRSWPEVIPALQNMVAAANILRTNQPGIEN